MMKPALIALAAALAFGAPADANAQEKTPETRDHRAQKKRKPRPDKGPVVRDHRDKDGVPSGRDHGVKGAVIRDHRDKDAKGSKDAKGAVRVNEKVMIDPNRAPGVLIRDHRMNKIDIKKRRAEYRVRAEARWTKRRAELAKDEADRLADYEKRREERIASREQRRSERRAAIRAAWEAKFLADAQVQAELELHARRVARINRLRRLAEIKDRGKLVIRIEVVAQHEDDRHTNHMQLLNTSFTANTNVNAQ